TVGTPVEDKDTLKTGPASNMQVRFTDESIVSLRDQSLLKIDEYKFTGKQDGVEKAFFNLLKGGFRTVTGVIGRVNKTNYGVKTATATIGIRGTHFALLLCSAGSCGAAAKDGVYGGVSGGIIAAINNTGEYQFGSGDYFYAPSQDSPVKKLIGPPGFFADHLAGQGHAVGRQAFAAGAGNVQTQSGGAASDSSPNSVTPPPPPQQFVVTENLGLNGEPAVLPVNSSLPTTGMVMIPFSSGAVTAAGFTQQGAVASPGGALTVDFMARQVGMTQPIIFSISDNLSPTVIITYTMDILSASYPSPSTQAPISGTLNCSAACASGTQVLGTVNGNFTGTSSSLGITFNSSIAPTTTPSPVPTVTLNANYK
ncbi:MAG: FecR family protein, partial [Burkholderiales bacterium]